MKYLSRRDNETIIEVISKDEIAGTVYVKYLNGSKVETTTAFSTGTIKRWWKEIEVQETETTGVTELSDEEYAKIGIEIAEQAKEKAEHCKKLVPMPGIEKLEVLKNEVELDTIIHKLQEAGFTINIVKGLPKTISIKTVGQLAVSKNGFRLKANLNFEFTSETPYETTKNYNKVMCQTLEDVLKIIQ